jgi:hypothetical protein
MKSGIKTLVCSLFAAAAVCAAPLQARPAHSAAAAAQGAIDAKFAELASNMARGETGARIVAKLYWPEASAGVEGMAKPLTGLAELGALMQASVPTGTGIVCKFTQSGKLVVSRNMASSFGTASCQKPGSDKPEVSRSLHVWEKRGIEWKIIREQLAMGSYD